MSTVGGQTLALNWDAKNVDFKPLIQGERVNNNTHFFVERSQKSRTNVSVWKLVWDTTRDRHSFKTWRVLSEHQWTTEKTFLS